MQKLSTIKINRFWRVFRVFQVRLMFQVRYFYGILYNYQIEKFGVIFAIAMRFSPLLFDLKFVTSIILMMLTHSCKVDLKLELVIYAFMRLLNAI